MGEPKWVSKYEIRSPGDNYSSCILMASIVYIIITRNISIYPKINRNKHRYTKLILHLNEKSYIIFQFSFVVNLSLTEITLFDINKIFISVNVKLKKEMLRKR